MKSNNPPVRHHYVHESYQKRFCLDKSKIVLFSFRKDFKTQVRESKPKQMCCIPDLNTISIFKEKVYFIEKFYCQLESQYADFLKNLVHEDLALINSKIYALNEFQSVFKLFISFMFWRNPAQRLLAKIYAGKILALYDSSPKEVKSIFNYDRKFIKSLQRKVAKEDVFKIVQYTILPLVTFDLFGDSKISFHRSKKGNFISSDNPVAFFGTADQLFKYENFIFPLDRYFVLSDCGQTINKNTVESINLLTAKNAEMTVFGSSRNLLNTIRDKLLEDKKIT